MRFMQRLKKKEEELGHENQISVPVFVEPIPVESEDCGMLKEEGRRSKHDERRTWDVEPWKRNTVVLSHGKFPHAVNPHLCHKKMPKGFFYPPTRRSMP